MVNTVAVKDFQPVRDTASKSSPKDKNVFKDALDQAASEGKNVAEKTKEPLGKNSEEGESLENGQEAAWNAGAVMPWMGIFQNQMQNEVAQLLGTWNQGVVAGEAAGLPQGELTPGPVQGVMEGEAQMQMQTLQEQLPKEQLPEEQQTPVILQQAEVSVSDAPSMEAAVSQEKAPEAVRNTAADNSQSEIQKQPEQEIQQKPEQAESRKTDALLSEEQTVKKEENVNAEISGTGNEVLTGQVKYRPENSFVPAEKGAEKTATMEELPKAILAGVKENRGEFEIQIKPEALGKLTIRASYQEGKAVISILCSDVKTAEILSTHARDLGAIMEANLGNPAEIVMDANPQENPDNDYPEEHGGNRERNEQDGGRRQQKKESESFLQQLRLGLV